MVILIFPIINNTQVLLDVWLVEVPAHAVNFANIILIYVFIDCFTTTLYTAIMATSKIREYEIGLTILYFTNIIVVYIVLKLGMVPESVFILAVLFKLGVLALLCHQCYKLFPFDWRSYGMLFVKIILPTLIFGALISFCYQYFFKNDSFLKLIVFSIVFELIMVPFIWFYGLSKNERQFVTKTIKTKFNISRK
jgi:hypothetical protein